MIENHLNRRQFLQTGSAALAGSMLVHTPQLTHAQETYAVSEKSKTPIVDTHQHLWNLEILDLPWLEGAPETLQHSFLMSDYLVATRNVNIAKTIYMEVNVAEDEKEKEADHVIGLAEADDNPMVAAIIGGLPHQTEFADYARKYAQSKYVCGVRNVLHDPDRPKGMCLEETFVRNMKLLGELGLTFDLCMRPGEIGDGVKLAKQCPETQFIIDHCGNMPVQGFEPELLKSWQESMKAAAELDNVACKISGIVVTAEKGNWTADDLAPHMNFCMDTFGEDKIVFGGDWPVCTLSATYQQWAEALFEVVKDRSDEFRKKLFHDNALKIYGVS
ncbi:MAG: amidohydrolase family protein [Planctomycetaceae bacterium]|nr:amidohydrolase family protein [Planctomycetaceae bacterium]